MKRSGRKDTCLAAPGEMLPEYALDYGKARPNRFASDRERGSRVVVLDPDVAEVFTTREAVNAALRELIAGRSKSD